MLCFLTPTLIYFSTNSPTFCLSTLEAICFFSDVACLPNNWVSSFPFSIVVSVGVIISFTFSLSKTRGLPTLETICFSSDVACLFKNWVSSFPLSIISSAVLLNLEAICFSSVVACLLNNWVSSFPVVVSLSGI